jgi:hypothetical protein
MDSGTEDPVIATLNFGKQAKAYLESVVTKEEPKHVMVTQEPAAPEEIIPEELSADAAEIMGKELPKDPKALLLMWGELTELQKKIKSVEMEIRKKVANHFVPNPEEGTNTVDLGKGWKVKVKHKLSRTADEAMFATVFEELGDDYAKEDLFKFKPTLIQSKYNKLSDANKVIFDQCIVMKPGSPTIEIVPPKEEK